MEKVEKLILIQLIGVFFLSVTILLLRNIISLKYAMIISLFTFSVINLFCIIKTFKGGNFLSAKYFRIFLIFIFVLVVISSFYLKNSYSINNITDHHIHLLLGKDIAENENIPPLEPCVLGERVSMTWFYYLLGATITISTGIPIEIVFFALNIYSLIIVTTLLFLVAKKMISKLFLRISFILFTLIILLTSYYIPSPFTFSFIFIFGVMYFLLFVQERKILIASALVGISILFHGYSFLINAFALFGCIVFLIIFDTKKIMTRSFIKEMAISLLILLFLVSLAFILKDKNSSLTGSMFFEPLSGMISLAFFIPFLPFVILSIFYIARPLKFRKETYLIANIILSVIIFSSSLLLLYGEEVPGRFYFFTIPYLFLLSFIFIDNIKNKKIILACFLILITFIYPFVSRLVFSKYSYFSDEELQYYYDVNHIINKSNEVVAASPNVYYTHLSNIKQIVCEPYLQIGHLSNVTITRERFEDLLRFYKDPSLEFVDKYNVKYVIFGKNEEDFLNKYDVKPFNFSKSPTFKEIYDSNNLKVFEIKENSHLPIKSNETLNYTYYSRWWTLPPK